MLFDSHAHLNFEAFDETWKEEIADCQKNNVWMVNIGSQLGVSKKSIEIANQYEAGVYAAVGLHPIHVPGSSFHPEEFNYEEYKALAASSNKVVAIGETGIDFFHDDYNLESQRNIFIQHIRLAKELDRALVVHGRNSKDGSKNAYQEIYNILKQEKPERAVIHCYGGTWEEAQQFIELGYNIGITGIVTFPKTEQLAEVATNIPLERLLIETDCPYLAPIPYRGKQNKPQYVEYVARKIAELQGKEYNEIAEITWQNAKAFYRV